MRKRVLQFNSKIFIDIDFTNFSLIALSLGSSIYSHSNQPLLHVLFIIHR